MLDHSSDAEALAKAMERLLEPDLRRGMGLAARALALQHDIDDNYRAVESFIDTRCIGGPRVLPKLNEGRRRAADACDHPQRF